MREKGEEIIAMAYKNWKKNIAKIQKTACPDEETLSAFKDGLLKGKGKDKILWHLLQCESCAENVVLDAAIQQTEKEVPAHLVQAAKDLVFARDRGDFAEIILGVREKFLQIIRTTMDKYVIPEPALMRSHSVQKRGDEVSLIKYFQNKKVALRITKTDQDKVRVDVTVTEKKKEKPSLNIRVSLLKDNQEIESYITKQGKAAFSHLSCGRYYLEISAPHRKIGRIFLELK